MKVFRRTPMPEPGARERALARLTAHPPPHPRPANTDLSPARPAVVRDADQPAYVVVPGAGELLHNPADPRRDHPRDDYLEERDDEVRGGWIPEQIRPERLRDARWTLTPRHVLVLLAVLAIGLSWAAWTFLRARPETLPTTQPTIATPGSPVAQPTPGRPQPATNQSPGANPSSGPNQPPATNQSPGAASSPGQPLLVVYVAGKVRRPGLVRAPTGSRVADVLALAGGPLPGVDLTTLNLARQITDGEQITVGLPTQPPPTNPPGTTTTSSTPGATSTDPINLNTATLAQLDALPGVGPVLAQRILDYRTQNGPFTTIDQLQEVPGVGPKKFDSLKPHVHL
ncbi:ComEA family DNA-binding protein [Kribbella rubisoli]|uniref:ComEA family DNA-binding protein n=1 Tax=Kribbella rubisoli TaxID=3075929 RepID=UPI001F53E891|nr:ComEA family DNA-binding protein [Kribbella rubisoli]